MKCKRCSRTVIVEKNGWGKCPKCSKTMFVGKPKKVKKEEEKEE